MVRLLTVVGILILASCGQSENVSPRAEACAVAVKVFQGLPNAVAIRGKPTRTSNGGVEIDYESFNRENIPVAGSAVCTFPAGHSLPLESAIVNGAMLGATDLSAVNSALAGKNP